MDDPTQNESRHAPVTFTYHGYPKLVGAAGMLFFGLCGIVTLLAMWDTGVDLFTVMVFPSFAFLSLVLPLWTNRRWTVQDGGIVTRSWNGHEELHYWFDMYTVEGADLGSGIRIKDYSGKTVLSLDPWIKDYDVFVETLRRRRKELFDHSARTLKRNPVLVVLGILFSLGILPLRRSLDFFGADCPRCGDNLSRNLVPRSDL